MSASIRGGTAPLGPGYTKPTLGTVGCCPYAKNGILIIRLTTSVMNPRRLIAAPEARTADRTNFCVFSGRGPMSALGQKQTYAPQQAMSASPPIATAKADIRKR